MRIVKRYKLFISFILLHSVTLCYKALQNRLLECIVFFMERRIITTSTNELEQEMTGWTGTVFGILGAILVAANIGMNDVGYIFFTIGSVFSLINAVYKKDNSGIILWGVFFLINVIGLVNYAK